MLNAGALRPSDIFALTYPVEGFDENRELLEHLETLGIPYVTESLDKPGVVDRVRNFAPDLIFSIHYRNILKTDILETAKVAAVNLHPSLLPEYKGCFSIPWALINGETQVGMTFHYMDAGVDTGNIIVQEKLEIQPQDTAFSLYHKLIALGAANFTKAYELAAQGDPGKVQPKEGLAYPRGVPHEGRISLDWGRKRVHDFIRAMYFPPHKPAVLDFSGEILEFNTPQEFDEFCLDNRLVLDA